VQNSSVNKIINSKISSVELTTITLVAIGFESSHATKKALIDHDGNMNQAIDYLVARSNSNDAANGTNHEQDGVVEDLATGSSLSGATTILAGADLAVLVTTAASAASDPAPTAPSDIESQRPQPARIEQQIVVDDKCFCITCTQCIGVSFSIFLAFCFMLLVGATGYFFGYCWGLLALVGYWTIMCCGLCGCIDNLARAFSRDGFKRVFNF
jgi:hypothetical protein